MRIGFIAVFLACMLSGTNPAAPVPAESNQFPDDSFFEKLDRMIPALSTKLSHDEFVVQSAEWSADNYQLVIKASTTHEKGTLITVMGLPESTMVDAFQISSDYSVEYELQLDNAQAVPCQVIVKSAFAAEIISVANAPSACNSRFQISGTVAVSPSLPIVNGWVTVVVDDVVFTTIASDDGRYDLEVYGDSNDAFVTITAEGLVDNRKSIVHIYAGNIDGLLDAGNSQARTWAKEIYGRRHGRDMLANLSSRKKALQ